MGCLAALQTISWTYAAGSDDDDDDDDAHEVISTVLMGIIM